MFLGTYRPRLDDKGRLILPAKFREQLADGLVMTKGQEHCLFVHRRDDFAQQVDGAEFRACGPGPFARLLVKRHRRGARPAGPNHHPADPARLRQARS